MPPTDSDCLTLRAGPAVVRVLARAKGGVRLEGVEAGEQVESFVEGTEMAGITVGELNHWVIGGVLAGSHELLRITLNGSRLQARRVGRLWAVDLGVVAPSSQLEVVLHDGAAERTIYMPF